MRMNTYVNFHGKCAEAFRYYERHLGAKVGMMMTHAQSPDQSRVGSEWKDAVLHARISIGDTELMAADIPNAEPMRSAYLTLRMDSNIEAERVFAATIGVRCDTSDNRIRFECSQLVDGRRYGSWNSGICNFRMARHSSRWQKSVSSG